jgi:hypothetical protein
MPNDFCNLKPSARSRLNCPILLGILASLVTIGLHLHLVVHPMVYFDDFPILTESWTWEAARKNILLPFNEHIMPLGRLSTWGLGQLANPITRLPFLTASQGILVTLIAMWLIFHFVQRETESPFLGLTAMILFGVTTIYAEAVSWFAASFTLLALDMVLLTLLAAQRWRQTGRGIFLFWSVIWAALAPGWFASGYLAGPLGTLYLFPMGNSQAGNLRHRILAMVPLLGTAIFVAFSMPFAADRLLHLDHYAGRSILEAFNPSKGFILACRSVVDKILLGFFGVSGVALPYPWLSLVLLLAIGSAVWWWRQGRQRRLMLLGLGFLLASSFFIYSARADWSYEEKTVSWTRYNVFPYLGLTLFICGGMAGRMETLLERFNLPWTGSPPVIFVLLMTGLFLVNLPRGLVLAGSYDPSQMEMFGHIAETDARCRAHHISASIARQALVKLPVPQWDANANGWIFLRGSDSPRASLEEARSLLNP